MTTYGCHNRPTLYSAYIVQDGWFEDFTPAGEIIRTARWKWVTDRSTRTCQYETPDDRCAGCKHIGGGVQLTLQLNRSA